VQAVLDQQVAVAWSQPILREYRDVLNRPRFGFDPEDVADLVGFIEAAGLEITPQPSHVDMPDEDDRVFYDTATTAAATLVTGNIKDFPEDERVVSLADFVVGLLDGT